MKPPTFAEARANVLRVLRENGWRTKEQLKVPQAISPDGRDVLYFKPQAVYLGPHSLWIDIRTISPEQFLASVRATIEKRNRSTPHREPTRAHLSSDAADFRYIRRESRDIQRAVRRLEARDRNMSKGSTMPLVHGYSPKSIEENVVREMRAGRPQPQAIAIAFETARKAWRHAHPRGPYPAHLRGMRKARRRSGGRNRAEGGRTYRVLSVHKISNPHGPEFWKEVQLPDGAFSDRKKLAAALRGVRVLSKGEQIAGFRTEGSKIVVFPRGGTIHAYILEG